MTENETRKWLQSIQLDSDELKKKFTQIEELRAVAESCTVRTDKESVQTSGSGDKMANVVGKIVDIEREIEKIDGLIIKKRNEFTDIVKLISDEREKEFLNVRYYDGNAFFDTVMIMNLSDSTVRRIQRKAITNFMTKYNEKHNI